jgi:hypothetical protein
MIFVLLTVVLIWFCPNNAKICFLKIETTVGDSTVGLPTARVRDVTAD